MQTQKVPLARHVAVDTRQPDEARDAIGRIFCPHFLNPTERRPRGFHARHHTVAQHDYSVNFVAYGADVEIDPGELSRFFLLQIPLKGRATVRCGTLAAEAQAGRRATLLSPTLPSRMTWHEGCEKLIILMRREALEAQFESLTHSGPGAIEFATGLDLASPVGMALFRHARMMQDAAEDDGAVPEAYQVMLRDGLSTLLLTGFAHGRSDELSRPIAAPAPSAVRRAEDYISAHAERPISTAEIAEAAGVSLRSLQDAFRRSRGLTLSDAILKTRLERFRAGLLDPAAALSVADIAFSVGFGHLGRAAAVYRDTYGETPSQTLRRRR